MDHKNFLNSGNMDSSKENKIIHNPNKQISSKLS